MEMRTVESLGCRTIASDAFTCMGDGAVYLVVVAALVLEHHLGFDLDPDPDLDLDLDFGLDLTLAVT